MERTDRRPILSAQINKIEPTFVPQWLKSTTHTSNHLSEDRGRNNNDTERSSATVERSASSLHRSSVTNDSQCDDREKAIHLRPYNSFGRNKDLNFIERWKPGVSENGSNNLPDFASSARNRTFANANVSIGNSISKLSFEKDFPSLRSEEKQGSHEIGRAQKLTGGDNWTSALSETPPFGINGPPLCVSGSMTGLNMAEALAQPPPQGRGVTRKISSETLRMEEIALKQSRQLVPVMSLASKVSVLSSSEKMKPKVSRVVDRDFSKAGQPVSHALRLSKPLQTGNFHVLNRERNINNGILPTANDALQSPINNPSRSRSAFPSKSDVKGTTQPVTAFIERRPPANQQNRSEFFNSLRKKTSAGSSSSTSTSQSTSLEKQDGQETVGVDSVNNRSKVDPLPDISGDDGSNNGEKDKGSSFDPEEEERLLRLFGWKENAGEEEEALTAEEIGAFLEEYQKRRPLSKFGHRNLNLQAVSGSGDTEKSSASSQAEAF